MGHAPSLFDYPSELRAVYADGLSASDAAYGGLTLDSGRELNRISRSRVQARGSNIAIAPLLVLPKLTNTVSACVGTKLASTSSPITASADLCLIRLSEPAYLGGAPSTMFLAAVRDESSQVKLQLWEVRNVTPVAPLRYPTASNVA